MEKSLFKCLMYNILMYILKNMQLLLGLHCVMIHRIWNKVIWKNWYREPQPKLNFATWPSS